MSIELEHVSYSYHAGMPIETKAISDVSLQIHLGEFVGLIGQTGSGKSTLIQLMNGLIVPQEGRVIIDGENMLDMKHKHIIRQNVGIVFQYPEQQLFASTVFEDVAFGPRNLGKSEEEVTIMVEEALEQMSIAPSLYQVSPFMLSGGQKRRVAIAGVLSMDPSYLILDEPTAGLDPSGQKELFTLLQEWKKHTTKTIILISHNMDDIASFCDRIIVLDSGRLAAEGTTQLILSDIAFVENLGLRAPQMSYIMRDLKNIYPHMPHNCVYTIDQAKDYFLSWLSI